MPGTDAPPPEQAGGPPARSGGLALHWKILIGLALGVTVGLLINLLWTPATWQALGVGDSKAYLAGTDSARNEQAGLSAGAVRLLVSASDLVAKLFLNSLRALAIPIVVCSLIVGAASLGDPRKLGRMGARTMGLFLLTCVLAIGIGLVLANVLRPGALVGEQARAQLLAQHGAAASARIADASQIKGVWQQLAELVPTNPFAALAQGQMLPLIVCALALGAALTLVARAKAQGAVTAIDAINDACTKLIELLMRAAPVCVFCLIVPQVAALGMDVLKALSAYAGVVALGLGLVLFVQYPLVLRAFSRVPVGVFFRAMAPAQLVALSSSSSSATLPVTMECARDRLGVDGRVVGFVCPLGATVNMDGTALQHAVATLFVAQVFGIELSLAQQMTIVLLATLSSIGSPGIPSGGIVMLVAVMQGVGLPSEALAGIALVIAIDRPLDMLRTVVNVSGDGLACAVVAGKDQIANQR